MKPLSILILGGTAEARDIAQRLVSLGHDVTSSLAGVTTSPALPVGKLRVGGFGGIAGLTEYLKGNHVDAVVDATHPFAAQMSRHAFAATSATERLLLRFERPAWKAVDGDQWIDVPDLTDAARVLPAQARVFLTTGRTELDPFIARGDLGGIIRTVEPLDFALPQGWACILDRPPHSIESEIAVMEGHRISHLVSKNSGGDLTRSKLDAARQLGIPVVMVARPAKPECETFSDVGGMANRLGT